MVNITNSIAGWTQKPFRVTNISIVNDDTLTFQASEYDDSVYTLRGVYNAADIDFDLTQFGLFMNGDTLFVTFHYNDMVDALGRKLMAGDVVEFPNLKDYHPLDTSGPKALPRYYVIQDAAFASEALGK